LLGAWVAVVIDVLNGSNFLRPSLNVAIVLLPALALLMGSAIAVADLEKVLTFFFGRNAANQYVRKLRARRWAHWIAPPRSMIVSENYSAWVLRRCLGSALPLVCIAAGCAYASEYAASAVCLCASVSLVTFIGLTGRRIRTGLFGSNAEEVIEIIGFIM